MQKNKFVAKQEKYLKTHELGKERHGTTQLTDISVVYCTTCYLSNCLT